MRTYRIAPAALALLTLSLLLPTAGGCFDGFIFPTPDDQRQPRQEPNDPNPDGDRNGDIDPGPDEPLAMAPTPTLRLSPRTGGIDSINWGRRESLSAADSARRKPLVEAATLIEVTGLTCRYQLNGTQNTVEVRFQPVPGGYDAHLRTDAKTDAEVYLYLGLQDLPGPAQVLLPRWAGHLKELQFPAQGGQQYDYPGSAFAPVYAYWNRQGTTGYAALAEVGDFVRLQLVQPRGKDETVMARVGFLNGCRAGQRLERTIAVRFSERSADWETVLRPYQEHQRRRDGPVRYQRLGPWVSYNMRNSHEYDEQTRNFKPGSTWENRLGRHWEYALKEARAGRLELGCLGVWCQMEEVDKELSFNPDALALERSLGGSLPDLMQRLRREYGPIPMSAFSRSTSKIEGNEIVVRDLDDPREWRAMLAELEGLKRLGFDVTYGDQVGLHGGWKSVDLVERAPIRIVSEWSWDRLLTRGSCLIAHRDFPSSQAALLVPYLTPGGELYVRTTPTRASLFSEGAVTPWIHYLDEGMRATFDRCAKAAEANRPERRP